MEIPIFTGVEPFKFKSSNGSSVFDGPELPVGADHHPGAHRHLLPYGRPGPPTSSDSGDPVERKRKIIHTIGVGRLATPDKKGVVVCNIETCSRN